MRLQGASAVVTGGSQGIGKAIAGAYLREGARVLIAARDVTVLDRTVNELRQQGGEVEAASLDVSDPFAVRRTLEQAEKTFGKLDVLVNCAGIYGPIGPAAELDLEAWRKTIEINLLGVLYCVQAVLPGMIQRRAGKIINLSGGGATAPLPRFSAYGASKAAVVRLTETLAREVEEFNIQINAIAPGAVNTRLLDEVLAAGDLAGSGFIARAREQKKQGGVPPERAAELAVFLASDQSNGLTGRLLSAVYDDWTHIPERLEEIRATDVYTLRRIDEKMAAALYPELKRKAKNS
jgi:NAD(P)-dependent dehydrogenase (short-subunit alcohol dehydrogenase family)